jgi:hypothetical protein
MLSSHFEAKQVPLFSLMRCLLSYDYMNIDLAKRAINMFFPKEEELKASLLLTRELENLKDLGFLQCKANRN